MKKEIKGNINLNIKLCLAGIFVLLGCLNIIGLLSLDKITVFCFTFSSFIFVLSDFFNKLQYVFLFIGLFCIIGFPLLANDQIILKIKMLLNEESILLLTIGLSFFNLYFSDFNEELLNKKLKIEYEKGVKDTIEEVIENIKRK